MSRHSKTEVIQYTFNLPTHYLDRLSVGNMLHVRLNDGPAWHEAELIGINRYSRERGYITFHLTTTVDIDLP